MLGLAALAALMAMAFAGTSSAMAEETQLCDADPGNGSIANCLSGHAVTSVHAVSVGRAKLLGSGGLQCDVLFSSTSVGELASPQVIEGHFTYTNCGCTVKEVSGGVATIKILKEGHESASVKLSAEIVGNCFGNECTYTMNNIVGTATGPLLAVQSNGEVVFSEQSMTATGSFCPASRNLDLTITPLTAAYIAN